MNAAEFKNLCNETGMEKRKLAEICKKHQTTFCRYFSGKTKPPEEVIEKIKKIKEIIKKLQ